MKINPEQPVSAFSVYSEKFRQKKKKKPAAGGVNKPATQRNKQFNKKEMEEIQNILAALAKQTNAPNSDGLKKLAPGKKTKKKKSDEENLIMEAIKDFEKTNNMNDNNYKLPKKSREISSSQNGNHKLDKLKTNETSFRKKQKTPKSSSICIDEMDNKMGSTGSKKPDVFDRVAPCATKSSPKSKQRKTSSSSPGKVISKSGKFGNTLGLDTNMDQSIRKEKINEEKASQKTKTLKIKQTKVDKSAGVMENTSKKQKLLENRMKTAKNLFEWLIQPISQEEFMKNYWEKRPLLVRRDSDRSYYSQLLSTPAIDAMLRENVVHFTKHLDVTSYTNGVRDTHNLTGRAQANVVWDFYANGCSVRLLSPQTFAPRLHALNATLQEWFGCLVGANAYLTPPSSQGFAPHYDDIEAFVMQIEGAKRWKVYAPRSENETLPRTSSKNFSQEEAASGGLLLDVILEPGDLLYFPRGFVHQATTADDRHSLHVTLSVYQRTAWVDLFEQVLPIALRRAASAELDLRRGLPRDYLNAEHGPDAVKIAFTHEANRLMGIVAQYLNESLGAAVDRMGAQFMHDALPPVLTAEEMRLSSRGGGLAMAENGRLADDCVPDIELDTQVKLISTNICRLVEDDESGEARLHHCLDNGLEYHGDEPQFLVLPPEGVEPVNRLCHAYPGYVRVGDLPHNDPEALVIFKVEQLYINKLTLSQWFRPTCNEAIKYQLYIPERRMVDTDFRPMGCWIASCQEAEDREMMRPDDLQNAPVH